MPYMKKKMPNGKIAVYKKGPDGKPVGEPMGEHESDEEANAQMAAIHANEKKPAKKDMGMMGGLPQDDPRVQYNPLGGLSGGEACANCEFFMAHEAMCKIVGGEIVATGKSNLWLPRRSMEPEPIPVKVVEGVEPEMEMGEEALKERRGLLTIIREAVQTWLGGKKGDDGALNGFKVLPNLRWVAYWTNNAEDLQGEWFSEKAIDAYIERVDKKEVPYPALWYWHIPVPYGQADWLGRAGHVVVATGTIDDTPVGRKFYDHYRKTAHKTSHGFKFYAPAFVDKTYHFFNTFEISPLPPRAAANPYTSFEEVKAMAITPEKRAALEAILGKELAGNYLAQAEQKSKELDELGVKFKETPLPTVDQDARDSVKALVETFAAAQKTLADQQAAAFKQLTETVVATMKPVQDDVKALDTRLKTLEGFVSEQFQLQPRATMASSTVVPPDSPVVQFMQAKEGGQNPTPTVFDHLFKAMGMEQTKKEGEL